MSAKISRVGSNEFWRTAERAKRLAPGEKLYVPPCVIAEMREMAADMWWPSRDAALSRKDQAR